MNYVIIGNSAAGIGAVEAIRKADSEGKITIIADEPHHTYSRPLISYLLLGKTDEQKIKYRPDSFYDDNRVELLAGKKAVSISVENKIISLEDGSEIPYDKLIVATGSAPFVPPMKGLEKVASAQYFMTLDDAHALRDKIKAVTDHKARVLIIGAGLIGLKCAEGISTDAEVTLVDLALRPLSSILEEESGEMIKKHLEDNGLRFFLGESVSEFSENSAILTGGETIDFDILVTAVGVRANTALVKDAGGAVGRGITIDDRMRTSLPDVYAAGDCTESRDVASGDIKIMALLPNAYMQGECAGFNMAGQDKVFDKAIPMNSIGFFGLHMVTAGAYIGETYVESEGRNYKKLFYKDNKLKGFIIIGDIRKAGIYTSLIREETPLDGIDFELICRNPGLMAFSRDDRTAKLGRDH